MRNQLVRTAATALIWIGCIEVISSFVAKQMYNYTLTFTPIFIILGIVGIIAFIISRFV
ncbi:MAG: hypothetical protein OWR52_05545 [Acidibacillus sp.]|uniref:hypothetical protein n=1 Tax=Sulfoacidibacillus ferrooxidans TaxID=2005001 RepID=UPI001F513029|nr:hypothetical protein [Sulfoacidibacillus ferrooxidans]MCY0892949.1 hypothetical protein [Acidibacillus sp.]